tara:strand:- start:13760 stop:13948 length:189 start_codon:yes stop_codon:yes gene_type:complete
MKVFIITTFEYSCYSYDGLKETDLAVFSTKEKAIAYTKENNLTITGDPDTTNHCTLECYDVD